MVSNWDYIKPVTDYGYVLLLDTFKVYDGSMKRGTVKNDAEGK